MIGVKQSSGPPARGRRLLLQVLIGFRPRQFQQRDRLGRVQPRPASVRPVPPHGHVGQTGPERCAVQSGGVPRRAPTPAPGQEHGRCWPDDGHDDDDKTMATAMTTTMTTTMMSRNGTAADSAIRIVDGCRRPRIVIFFVYILLYVLRYCCVNRGHTGNRWRGSWFF